MSMYLDEIVSGCEEETILPNEVSDQEEAAASIVVAGMEEEVERVQFSGYMMSAGIASLRKDQTTVAGNEEIGFGKAMSIASRHAIYMSQVSPSKPQTVSGCEEEVYADPKEVIVAGIEEKMSLLKKLSLKAATLLRNLINKMKKGFGKLVVILSSNDKKIKEAVKSLKKKVESDKKYKISAEEHKSLLASFSGIVTGPSTTTINTLAVTFKSYLDEETGKVLDGVNLKEGTAVKDSITNLIKSVLKLHNNSAVKSELTELIKDSKAKLFGDTFSEKSDVVIIGKRRKMKRVLIIDRSDSEKPLVAVKKLSFNFDESKFSAASEVLKSDIAMKNFTDLEEAVKQVAKNGKKLFDTADKAATKDLDLINKLAKKARDGEYTDEIKTKIAILKVTGSMGYGMAMDKFGASKDAVDFVNSVTSALTSKDD